MNERVLEDDYPLYPCYLYVVGGKPFMNVPDFKTVKEMREKLIAAGFEKEGVVITSCDIIGRNLEEYMI